MNGFRFACQPGCTNCCRVKGYVYLTENDLRRAAALLGLEPRAFEAKYVYRTRHLLRLRKPRNAECHFLEEHGCALHPHKPAQCRLFPFWPELVRSPSSSRHGVSRYCPGVGKGELVSIQAVMRMSGEMREAYPTMYSATGGAT